MPLDYQNVFMKGMEEVGVKLQWVSINTGHCPNLTRPREIAKIVQKIANREAVGYEEDEQRLAEGASTKDVEGGIERVDATDACVKDGGYTEGYHASTKSHHTVEPF